MQLCLNLCELLNPIMIREMGLKTIYQKALENIDTEPERIYIGSNFCSQYTLNMNRSGKSVLDFLNELNLPVTYTLPIFSQKNLSAAKELTTNLLSKKSPIDEVTVNDYGMLNFINENFNKKINLGRLFFKDPRDIRVPDHFKGESSIAFFDFLDQFDQVSGVEIDPITKVLNLKEAPGKTIALHYPYCYMTTGNICKFESISQDIERKFRPNQPCQMDCGYIHEFYTQKFGANEDHSDLFRLGRTVYFDSGKPKVNGAQVDRMIYFPLKELALLGQPKS